MKIVFSALSPYRASLAVAGLLLAAVCIIAIEASLVQASTAPWVGDYLVRVVRAMGLEGTTGSDSNVGSRAPLNEYLSLLVRENVITTQVAAGVRADEPLTRDFALGVSRHITDPPAPSFLSEAYVASTFLADHGTALGLVGPDDDDHGLHDLFNARGLEREQNCPGPRHRLPRHYVPCPSEP